MTLREYFGVNFEHAEVEDLHLKIKAIGLAETLDGGEIDTLLRTHHEGLMDSGDTPSKAGRASLLEKGIICQTCWKKNDYTFSVTYPLGYEVINAMSVLPK
jgi:hypothetical protein